MGYRITRRYLLLLLVVLFQSAAYAQYVLTEATNAYNLYQFDAAKHLFTKAYKKSRRLLPQGELLTAIGSPKITWNQKNGMQPSGN